MKLNITLEQILQIINEAIKWIKNMGTSDFLILGAICLILIVIVSITLILMEKSMGETIHSIFVGVAIFLTFVFLVILFTWLGINDFQPLIQLIENTNQTQPINQTTNTTI